MLKEGLLTLPINLLGIRGFLPEMHGPPKYGASNDKILEIILKIFVHLYFFREECIHFHHILNQISTGV